MFSIYQQASTISHTAHATPPPQLRADSFLLGDEYDASP